MTSFELLRNWFKRGSQISPLSEMLLPGLEILHLRLKYLIVWLGHREDKEPYCWKASPVGCNEFFGPVDFMIHDASAYAQDSASGHLLGTDQKSTSALDVMRLKKGRWLPWSQVLLREIRIAGSWSRSQDLETTICAGYDLHRWAYLKGLFLKPAPGEALIQPFRLLDSFKTRQGYCCLPTDLKHVLSMSTFVHEIVSAYSSSPYIRVLFLGLGRVLSLKVTRISRHTNSAWKIEKLPKWSEDWFLGMKNKSWKQFWMASNNFAELCIYLGNVFCR